MPSATFHPRTVGNFELPSKSKGRIRYWDTTTTGLHILATPTERIYKARFHRANGSKIDYRIGRVEDWALSAARLKAEKIIEAAKLTPDDDPQSKKLKARSKEETFGVLAEKCMESLSLRPTTVKNWGGIVKNHLVPRFGNMDAAKIDRKMIRDFTEKMGKSMPVQAARAFEVMRRIFSWAVEHEHLHGTPFAGLKKPPKVQEADSLERSRCLNRAEMHKVFATLKDDRFTGMDVIKAETASSLPDFDKYIRLLFETAVRRDEMLKATWAEIDMAAGFLTVSALRFKSKKPHQVPLTPTAVSILKSIQRQDTAKAALDALRLQIQNTKDADERAVLKCREEAIVKRMEDVASSDFVFPGPNAARPRTSAQRAFEELRRRAGFEDWWLHDIRRTVSRELGRLGTLPHVNVAIKGHALDKLARTYGAEAPLLEMRAALEKWSKQLDEIIREAPSVDEFRANAREV